ncbi:hypothetical protein Ahy_B03g061751 isoform C [Arachis hypogaea]|uniref:Uncharacterized protein n=1 Tax=Arachis hypogaea TaxID=3818 RepID=A0A444ZRT5_ARAHY|nr:hypothetical protein Ahy_B03g061751 isoform C [Arachis hypogaea]
MNETLQTVTITTSLKKKKQQETQNEAEWQSQIHTQLLSNTCSSPSIAIQNKPNQAEHEDRGSVKGEALSLLRCRCWSPKVVYLLNSKIKRRCPVLE